MQGTLRDFRVAEILQLVAVQQKTGLLRVQGPDATLTFYFDHGVLVSCRDRRRVGSDPLLDYMRRTGWLDPSTARQLESELQGKSDDLAEVLLQRQVIDSDDLAGILDDLAQDLITSSYGWRDGSYLFIAGDEALLGLNNRMSRNIEGLLMEAARRADEWPRLLEKIPGPETVVGDLQSVPNGLGAATRAILERLQQPITMHELATQARVPEFEVYETVAQAIESKMARVLERPRLAPAPSNAPTVDLTDAGETTPSVPASAPRPATPRRSVAPGVRRFLTWSVCLILSVAALFGTALQAQRHLQLPTPEARVIAAARTQLAHDLEVHRAVFGRYPATLDALIEAELTSAEVLSQAMVRDFRRYEGGTRYHIQYERDA